MDMLEISEQRFDLRRDGGRRDKVAVSAAGCDLFLCRAAGDVPAVAGGGITSSKAAAGRRLRRGTSSLCACVVEAKPSACDWVFDCALPRGSRTLKARFTGTCVSYLTFVTKLAANCVWDRSQNQLPAMVLLLVE